ncbi:MAG: nitrite reductase (NAD(P)H) small subunit [Nitrospirae bacterium]|nr:nitrite reductase (NAD(P)H) small subunit [Candidatus Manganitrophaceae bacterium]
MQEWVRMTSLNELPLGTGKKVSMNGKDFAVFHLSLGLFVLDNHCRYRDGDLGQGKIQGQTVICTQHGCRFNIVSGECLDNKDIQLGTYRVKTTDQEIFVQIY